MALTRRTQRFGDLAAAVEERLAQQGVAVDPKGIDAELRARVEAVAQQLGISDRIALNYAPDDLPDEIAKKILIVARELVAINGLGEPGPRRGHLRLVQ